MIHRQKRYLEVCRQPLEYEEDKPLQRLINLMAYTRGAYEIENSRVLVCVKNLGVKKTGMMCLLATQFLLIYAFSGSKQWHILCSYGSWCLR